jgi:hypothetical protein
MLANNFNFLVLSLLLCATNKLVSADCEFFETKRTCECKAMYSIGQNYTLGLLFSTASYDDCGVNLDCGKFDCGINCVSSIRRLLGGQPGFITDLGKNALCGMLAPSASDVISVPGGIGVWAAWSYSGCRSGVDLIQQDVCCNRKCKCTLTSQDVKVSSPDTELKEFQNFPICKIT